MAVRTHKRELLGIGQGLVDLQAKIPHDALSPLGVSLGASIFVEEARQAELLNGLKELGHTVGVRPGGSVANSAALIAQLGGSAAFTGRIGDDSAGAVLCHDFASVGVRLGAPLVVGGRTGTVLVVTTPCGERSMLAHLGCSNQFSLADVDLSRAKKSYAVFLEGYLMAVSEESRAALLTTAQESSRHGSIVALSLGASSLVEGRKKEFQGMLPHTGLLFGNEAEACALTGKASGAEAIQALSTQVPRVVVTCGAEGALISEHGKIEHVSAYPTKVVDTTGAGDAFAGGFLYGMLEGHSATRSAAFGNFLASKVVAIAGARLGAAAREAFEAEFDGA
jgi:sugar/nucleoside kinase (ribokinase family)